MKIRGWHIDGFGSLADWQVDGLSGELCAATVHDGRGDGADALAEEGLELFETLAQRVRVVQDVACQGDACAFRAQELLEVEARQDHDGRAPGQRPVHDHEEPVYVEEGKASDQRVVLGGRSA